MTNSTSTTASNKTNASETTAITKLSPYIEKTPSKDIIVKIPEGITVVRNRAYFDDAKFVKKSALRVELPNTLTTIEAEAFAGLQIDEVTIPKSVTSIGEGAFYKTKRLIAYDTLKQELVSAFTYTGYWTTSYCNFEIVMKSAETEQILFKLYMPLENGNSIVRYELTHSWNDYQSFEFENLDNIFDELPNKDAKIRTAINRLLYPIDLTPELKMRYEKYLSRIAKDIVRLLVQTDDIDTFKQINFLNLVKRSNIADLLEITSNAEALHAYILEEKQNRFPKASMDKKPKPTTLPQMVEASLLSIMKGEEVSLTEVLAKINKIAPSKRTVLMDRIIEFGTEEQIDELVQHADILCEDDRSYLLSIAIKQAKTNAARSLIKGGVRLRVEHPTYTAPARNQRLNDFMHGGYWHSLLEGKSFKRSNAVNKVFKHPEKCTAENYFRHGFNEKPLNNDECIITLAKEGLLTKEDISTICLLAARIGWKRERLALAMLDSGATKGYAQPVFLYGKKGNDKDAYWLDDFVQDSMDIEQFRIILKAGIQCLREGLAANNTIPSDKEVLKEFVIYVRPDDISNKSALFKKLIDYNLIEEAKIIADWPTFSKTNIRQNLLDYAHKKGATEFVAMLLDKQYTRDDNNFDPDSLML